MAPLTVGLFNYLHTAPLKRGEITPTGFDLDFIDHGKGRAGELFLQEIDEMPYDICEMGISTAIAMKEYGVPLTPIPVFTVRRFDYNLMFMNTDAGIRDPSELEGRTIAVRSPNATIDILCAAMLRDVYGVDLSTIHWIATGGNHIADARLPEHTELRPGADPAALVESGEAVATFAGYKGDNPKILPLIADLPSLYADRLRAFDCTTIHHTVVVKNDVLAANPGLAESLLDAFTRAKQPFLDRLASGEDFFSEMKENTSFGPGHDYGIQRFEDIRRPDPSPYGLATNRAMLDSLLSAAYAQNYLSRIWEVEEIFAQ